LSAPREISAAVSGFVWFCPVFREWSIRALGVVSGFVWFCPVFRERSIRALGVVSGFVWFCPVFRENSIPELARRPRFARIFFLATSIWFALLGRRLFHGQEFFFLRPRSFSCRSTP
jgi:hypothetical protein